MEKGTSMWQFCPTFFGLDISVHLGWGIVSGHLGWGGIHAKLSWGCLCAPEGWDAVGAVHPGRKEPFSPEVANRNLMVIIKKHTDLCLSFIIVFNFSTDTRAATPTTLGRKPLAYLGVGNQMFGLVIVILVIFFKSGFPWNI